VINHGKSLLGCVWIDFSIHMKNKNIQTGTEKQNGEINQITMNMRGKILASNGGYMLAILWMEPDKEVYMYAVVSIYKGRLYVDGIGRTVRKAILHALSRCDNFEDDEKIRGLLKVYRQKYERGRSNE